MSTKKAKTSNNNNDKPCSSGECMELLNSWKSSIAKSGEYKRKPTAFHDIVAPDHDIYKPEKNRYTLYVSYACPWASRTLAFRALKGLTNVINIVVVHPFLGDGGWKFEVDESFPDCESDPNNGFQYLREIYQQTDSQYEGNVTVPVLYDTKTKTIVNNESSEIIRILNSAFNEFSETENQRELDLYPKDLRDIIDATNEWIYPTINNGVYRCGFATAQKPYEEAFHKLFASLDRCEEILSKQRYIASNDRITEADIRLFVTLIRFDAVYYHHFKCNWARISDYPNVYEYTKELYQNKEIKSTVRFDHIKYHYQYSHDQINPFRIVSVGPNLKDYETPHKRDSMFN